MEHVIIDSPAQKPHGTPKPPGLVFGTWSKPRVYSQVPHVSLWESKMLRFLLVNVGKCSIDGFSKGLHWGG